jgi:hypothetical protein
MPEIGDVVKLPRLFLVILILLLHTEGFVKDRVTYTNRAYCARMCKRQVSVRSKACTHTLSHACVPSPYIGSCATRVLPSSFCQCTRVRSPNAFRFSSVLPLVLFQRRVVLTTYFIAPHSVFSLSGNASRLRRIIRWDSNDLHRTFCQGSPRPLVESTRCLRGTAVRHQFVHLVLLPSARLLRTLIFNRTCARTQAQPIYGFQQAKWICVGASRIQYATYCMEQRSLQHRGTSDAMPITCAST